MPIMVENINAQTITPANGRNPRQLYEHQEEAVKKLDAMDYVTDDGNSEDSQVTEESDESGVDDAGAAESDSGEEENSEETTSDGNA